MYGRTTVDDTATLVAAAGAGAPETILRNMGQVDCYVGTDSSVADTTGMLLKAGEVMGFFGQCSIYAITAAGSTTVAFFKAD